MSPRCTSLRLYGALSDAAALDWSWVQEQPAEADTYWVVARSPSHPHPRPVWGVWQGEKLHLSVGSPRLVADLGVDSAVTVHLGGGTEVVIVEGIVGAPATAVTAVTEYNRKYDWDYDVAQYGDLLVVQPLTVLSWRCAGRAGRDGFREAGRWEFAAPDDV